MPTPEDFLALIVGDVGVPSGHIPSLSRAQQPERVLQMTSRLVAQRLSISSTGASLCSL